MWMLNFSVENSRSCTNEATLICQIQKKSLLRVAIRNTVPSKLLPRTCPPKTCYKKKKQDNNKKSNLPLTIYPFSRGFSMISLAIVYPSRPLVAPHPYSTSSCVIFENLRIGDDNVEKRGRFTSMRRWSSRWNQFWGIYIEGVAKI